MQVTELSSQGLLREYKIVVPNQALAEKVTARINELARTAQLPGFRPGKVPVSLLRKQFGKALYGEALEQSIQDGAKKLLEDRGLKPAMLPQVDIKEVGEDKDLEFEVKVELLPEIGKVDFATIELERHKVAVDDKAIDEAVGRIAQANREQQAVERPAGTGDVVKIDFVGIVEGIEFPNGAAQDYVLEIGSGSLIPGFEEQLIGISAGESRDVSVTFPADYANKDLAGKAAVFKVTCKEVRAQVDQPPSEELARKIGFQSLEEMRKQIADRIQQDYAQLTRNIIKRKLLDKLHEGANFDVPQGLVDAEFAGIWRQYEDARKRAEQARSAAPAESTPKDNAPPEATKADDDLTEDEAKARSEYRAIAERRVRLGLLLAETGRSANVQVGNEEVNRAIMREAQRFPGQEQRVIEFYTKNPEMRESLRAPIFEDKTIDYILELAKVTDKTVSPEELLKAAREGDEADQPGQAASARAE